MSATITVTSGRHVTHREARAAAKAKVTIDAIRGRHTPAWIVELAEAGR